ncbi:phytoene/squalene synthase family protein [Caenimonas aquaedulcis]|uniref:Squalene/phytoene synthase family protein n=1 Tax=Caenimonas aquaedulcis TaxID=2793270 RepID=A0A931MFM4_9BURK|nr:squalene/phytoene synthase family protein [Caenimonas aquaedulcis]MBG9387466.1 squalene/phytoene synthase family protein [Caenimonas aquaedulcis]
MDAETPPAAPSSPDLARLLRSVSRSFDLSIRLLPRAVRAPVAVAYLLARAADTLADTSQVPAAERGTKLSAWAAAVSGDLADPGREVRQIAESFAPMQSDADERALILALPACLDALSALDADDRADVRAVLRHITRGQALDVQRFADPGRIVSLANAAELDEYTYLVAGCVGEFWTALCDRHLPHFAALPLDEMRNLGRRYGQALQLVNILRDAEADAAAGRCYLPADEVAALGIPAVRRKWLEHAHTGLAQGSRYADAVHSRRVRAATALPALIGIRTLALLEQRASTDSRPVKVPRSQVRSLLLRIAVTFASRGPLRRMFEDGAASA